MKNDCRKKDKKICWSVSSFKKCTYFFNILKSSLLCLEGMEHLTSPTTASPSKQTLINTGFRNKFTSHRTLQAKRDLSKDKRANLDQIFVSVCSFESMEHLRILYHHRNMNGSFYNLGKQQSCDIIMWKQMFYWIVTLFPLEKSAKWWETMGNLFHILLVRWMEIAWA